MKQFISLLVILLCLISCSANKQFSCKMKPIKHKKYRVKRPKNRKVGNYVSASTQTGKTKQTTTGTSSLDSQNLDEKPIIAEEENIVSITDTIIEEPTLEPAVDVEEPTEEEPPIYFTSNIQRQTFELLDKQSTPFDARYHINFNNKMYELKENITFYQRVVFKEDLEEDINQVELSTVLNDVARSVSKPNTSIVIHSPSNALFLLNGKTKKYNVVHITDNEYYEVYKQELSDLESFIVADKFTDEEIYQTLKIMLRNRTSKIKNHFIEKGFSPESVIIKQNPSIKNIVIEVK